MPQGPEGESGGKADAARRTLFSGLIAAITWMGQEYPQVPLGASREGIKLWYSAEVAGVPAQYLVLAGTLSLLAPYILMRQRIALIPLLRRLGLWRWIVLVWLTLTVSLAMGIVKGAPELFVDWRNWVVVAVCTWATATWLSGRSWARNVMGDLAVAYGLISFVHIVLWAFGAGVTYYGIRIPVFYGFNLLLAGFGSFVAIDMWMTGLRTFGWAYTAAVRLGAISGALVIALSFRRFAWLFLTAGLVLCVVIALRRRLLTVGRGVATALGVLIVTSFAVSTIGPEAIVARASSILPSADNQYSNTNYDHVNDLLDALDVVADEPLFGIGIGTTYQTQRISEWKTKSFDVHNAFLHVWLKFGLLGLVTYVGFHARLILSLLGFNPSAAFPGFAGCGVFFLAEVIPAVMQTWPYASFQLTVHRGVVLGVAIVAVSTMTTGAADHLRPARKTRSLVPA
jgi:O-antigen ligase